MIVNAGLVYEWSSLPNRNRAGPVRRQRRSADHRQAGVVAAFGLTFPEERRSALLVAGLWVG